MSSGKNFHRGNEYCALYIFPLKIKELKSNIKNSKKKKKKKESTCKKGDPGSIPGSERSTGEGIGYPFQYSWASLVAQLVKNLPKMRETWVWSLGWEDPLEKGLVTHSSILAWRIPWTVQSMGSQRVGNDWATCTFTVLYTWNIVHQLNFN